MLHVDRRAQSSVDVQVSRSPVQRYLDGARGYAKPDRLPPEVQARVVPMFCRSALEAAAANIVRRRAAQHGTDLNEADEQIAEARSLRETLALVLFGDAGRHGEVGGEIKRRYGAASAALVTELNRGAHGNPLDARDARPPPRPHAQLHPRPRDDRQVSERLTVSKVLDEAERQLDEFDPHTSGAWPHAAAALIRQSPGAHARRVLDRSRVRDAGDEPARPLGLPARLPRRQAGGARSRLRVDARSRTRATTARTRSASRRTSCAPISPRRAGSSRRSLVPSRNPDRARARRRRRARRVRSRRAVGAAPRAPARRAPEHRRRLERRRDQRRLRRRDDSRTAAT